MTTTVLHCGNEDQKEPFHTTTCSAKSKLVDYTKQRRNDMGSCFSLFADNEYIENKHTSTTRTTKYQKELKYLTEEVLRAQKLAREKPSCCSSGHDSDGSDYVDFLLPPLRLASYRRTPIPRELILEKYKRRSQSSQCSSSNNNISNKSTNEEVLESSNLVQQKRKRKCTRNSDRSSSLSSTKSSSSIISFILRDFINK